MVKNLPPLAERERVRHSNRLLGCVCGERAFVCGARCGGTSGSRVLHPISLTECNKCTIYVEYREL